MCARLYGGPLHEQVKRALAAERRGGNDEFECPRRLVCAGVRSPTEDQARALARHFIATKAYNWAVLL